MINGVRRYRQLRCAGPVTLISLGIALMNFNQLNHRACHTERDKTEDILSCLPESNLRGIAQCWADYSGAIQMAVAPPVPDIQMFSIMCCSHRRLIRCLHRQVPEKCPGSRVQARKLMLDMLDQLGNDFFSMACGRWDNERCMTSGEYAQLDSMHFEPSDQDPAFLFIPIMNFTAKLSFDPFKEHSRPLWNLNWTRTKAELIARLDSQCGQGHDSFASVRLCIFVWLSFFLFVFNKLLKISYRCTMQPWLWDDYDYYDDDNDNAMIKEAVLIAVVARFGWSDLFEWSWLELKRATRASGVSLNKERQKGVLRPNDIQVIAKSLKLPQRRRRQLSIAIYRSQASWNSHSLFFIVSCNL